MNVGVSIWDKLTRVVMFLLLLAAGLGVVFWYLPVVEKNENMRQRKLLVEKDINSEERINENLKAQLKAMNDPRTIERLARERLSYAKPGESVIRFEAPSTNATTGNAETPELLLRR